MAKARTWGIIPGRDIVFCYDGPDFDCNSANFVSARRLTSFHDAELAQCTTEINALLSKLQQGNAQSHRQLAVLRAPNGLFLAWVEDGISSAPGIAPPSKEDEEIEKALGIQ